MEPQYPKTRSYGPQMKMTIPPSHSHSHSHSQSQSQLQSQHSDNDRSSVELRALDCNLTSLCDHIQMEGFNSGSFSDIVVNAMGSTYHLHRLILSRSSYFRSDCNFCSFLWQFDSLLVKFLKLEKTNVSENFLGSQTLLSHHPVDRNLCKFGWPFGNLRQMCANFRFFC